MVQQCPESTCLTLPFLHKACGTQWQGTAKEMLDKGGKDGVGQVRQEARVGARSWNHLSWGRSLPSLPEAELTFSWLPVQNPRLHRTCFWFQLLTFIFFAPWPSGCFLSGPWACCQRAFPLRKEQTKPNKNPKLWSKTFPEGFLAQTPKEI